MRRDSLHPCVIAVPRLRARLKKGVVRVKKEDHQRRRGTTPFNNTLRESPAGNVCIKHAVASNWWGSIQDGISSQEFATVILCTKVSQQNYHARLSQLCLLEYQAFWKVMQYRLSNCSYCLLQCLHLQGRVKSWKQRQNLNIQKHVLPQCYTHNA